MITSRSTNGTERWDIIDEGSAQWSSMARTTGLVTVEAAEMLADGTIFDQMNPHEKLPVNYDLKQLFIGSEGTLVSYRDD